MGAVKLGLVAALILASLAGAALAQAPAGPPQAAADETTTAAQPAGGRIVVRRGDLSDLGEGAGLAVVTGRQVRIAAQTPGDIFAAGGELMVDGANADHLFLAGRELDLAPAAVRDLIAAGGRIWLRSGAVHGDVVAAGEEIRLDPGVRIDGSAVLSGARLYIGAPVGRALMARGGRVELNAPVAGDARLRGRVVVIGPQARIGGDLHVRGERIEISPRAVVQGRTDRAVVRRRPMSAARYGLPATLFVLGVLLMIGVAAGVAPLLLERVDQRLRSRFWVTLGIGAAILILGPLVILALLASVLGAPLGLLLALAYLLAMPLAFAGVSYAIGQLIRGRLARDRRAAPAGWTTRVGWTVLAALLVMILCVIPFLGPVVWLLVQASGFGALAAQMVPRRVEGAPAPA